MDYVSTTVSCGRWYIFLGRNWLDFILNFYKEKSHTERGWKKLHWIIKMYRALHHNYFIVGRGCTDHMTIFFGNRIWGALCGTTVYYERINDFFFWPPFLRAASSVSPMELITWYYNKEKVVLMELEYKKTPKKKESNIPKLVVVITCAVM